MSADKPYAHIQYKGTDICMDFRCACAIEDGDDGFGHFDGYSAYSIKCSNCGRLYEMPTTIELTPVDSASHDPIEINGNDRRGL